MSARVATAPEAIQQLERLYEFREPEEVRAFLAKNPDLVNLVIEAAAKIPEFLPPDGRIVLEVVPDLEDEEGEGDELFALVPTRMPWKEVWPRYHRLEREWLIFSPGRITGRFNVGPEYR